MFARYCAAKHISGCEEMANLQTFEATLNGLEEQLTCVDARLLEGAKRNKSLRDKLGRVPEDQAACAAESAQLIRQIAELECQIEDKDCLGSIRRRTDDTICHGQGSSTCLRLQMRQSCEDFLGQCANFREDHNADRLDAQLQQLQQQAANVQARLAAAKLATKRAQAQAQTAKERAIHSEARCKQAAAARQGLEERVAAEKDTRNRLHHLLADAQKGHLERNKENERAACAAALTQEAIAECLSSLKAQKAEKLQQDREGSRLRHQLNQKEMELARMRRSMDALQPKSRQPGHAPGNRQAALLNMGEGCHLTPLLQQQIFTHGKINQQVSPCPYHIPQMRSTEDSTTGMVREVWQPQAFQAAAATGLPGQPAHQQSIGSRQGWPVPAVAALTARTVPVERQRCQPSLPQAALPTALQLHAHTGNPARHAGPGQAAGYRGAAIPAHIHNQEAQERPRLPYIVTEPDSPQAHGTAQGQALKGKGAVRAEPPGPSCIFTETTVTRTMTPTKVGCRRQESWRVQELHRLEVNSRQQLQYSVFTAAAQRPAQHVDQAGPGPIARTGVVAEAGTCVSSTDGLAEALQAGSGRHSQGRGRGRRQQGRGKAGSKPRRTLKRVYPDKEEPSPFDWEARRQAEAAADEAEQDILLSSVWS